MRIPGFGCALSVSATAALLSACGGSQFPASAPSATTSLSTTRGGAPRRLTVSFEVLHRFGRHTKPGHNHGGARPAGGLLDVNGTLYGTTSEGGYGDAGVVYTITTTGTKKVLHRFCCGYGDAVQATGDLVDVNGTLYGTSEGGGKCGSGTVFSITTTGTENVLHSFCDGYGNPDAGLVNVNGTLYGTAGPSSAGDVFSITTSGGYKVLHFFVGGKGDGWAPYGPLVNVNGTLYGTTAHGGTGRQGGCYSNGGCGVVYSITPAGAEKVLYSFQNGSDGWLPLAGLIEVNGTLYGTTYYGGGTGCYPNNGCGTVYSVTTDGTEKVLYRFTGGSDGDNPNADLLDVNGMLYGTASDYSAGHGTVFSISTSGGEQVLHSFNGHDGASPTGGLTEVNGTLYGATYSGGSKFGCSDDPFGIGCGTVFALSP